LAETGDLVRQVGHRSVEIVADLTVPEDCTRAIAAAAEALGPPDILINNVGAARFKPVHAYTAEELDFHYAVSFRSMALCSREALSRMIPRKRGTIVNIASSSGKKPYKHQGPYCAMKAAVIAMSKVMALELREHGIRVHVVCPGAVDTAMADQVHPERDRAGWMQPQDIAQVVLDLLALPEHLTVDEVVMRRYLAEPM
jgi:NAD(P)-dependent dehydrogenase (short-subunit alcohol dehydrogenase family)